MGLIDEIIIKRIHIEEKITGHFLSLWLRSQWFITPSCFDHIRNAKCPNDSRSIVPFVASVPFWFLAGKYALENSSIVCRMRYFLVDIFYLWKLGRVVIDFACVVASWFRQNFDQIESIFNYMYICSYISFKYIFFQGFNFHRCL